MAAFMKSFEAQAYAVMRIVFGFTFLWHGGQKLFGFPSAAPAGIPDLFIAARGSGIWSVDAMRKG